MMAAHDLGPSHHQGSSASSRSGAAQRHLPQRRDGVRRERIQRSLHDAEIDALVCARANNVLLLGGYAPVVGPSIAVASTAGSIVLVVPDDERPLAERGLADDVYTYAAGTLETDATAIDALRTPLRKLLRTLDSVRTIGVERGVHCVPTTYAAMQVCGTALLDLIGEAMPHTRMVAADAILDGLRAVPTAMELERIRAACASASRAFAAGVAAIRCGMRETEVAAAFRAPLGELGDESDDGTRADGFTYCMSGPHAADAYAAYQRSRPRRIAPGDVVLVHCNSYRDGYWTDITRTFCLGEPDRRLHDMYGAVLAARRAALDAIAPGVHAADVDAAARAVLQSRGYGAEFRHGLGHGVGFAAIDHAAHPRLHPASHDTLQPGMVFNVEPAIYCDGYAGIRHCDMVVVGDSGAEVLTRFLTEVTGLVLPQ